MSMFVISGPYKRQFLQFDLTVDPNDSLGGLGNRTWLELWLRPFADTATLGSGVQGRC